MSGTRVLYVSVSIGLGYTRRDLTLAHEPHRLDPGVGLVRLARELAKQVIAEPGETLLLASAACVDETAVAEDAAKGFPDAANLAYRVL